MRSRIPRPWPGPPASTRHDHPDSITKEPRSRWPRASVPTSRTTAAARAVTASGCACERAPAGRSSRRGAVKAARACPPESERRVRSRDVRAVLDRSRPRRGRRVVLFLAPGSGEWAVVVTRRVGGAVDRNRAKRILREAWRQVSPQVTGDFDTVLVAREAIRGATTQDLVSEMIELLPRRPCAMSAHEFAWHIGALRAIPADRGDPGVPRPLLRVAGGSVPVLPDLQPLRRGRDPTSRGAPRLGLAAWRIGRCNPYGRGGFDPVPPTRHSARPDV